MSRVGIVAALATEARALTSNIEDRGTAAVLEDGTLLIVSGIGLAAAQRCASELIDHGATGLVSFGLAGGLDPALKAGRIFLPSEVFEVECEGLRASPPWRIQVARALASLQPVTDGKLLTSLTALTTVAAKETVFRATGALAVDMESAAIARVAASRNLPFLGVRVIVDTATDVLPKSVMAANSSGELQIWRLLASLARAPAEVPDVIRLARRFRAAQGALRAAGNAPSLRQAV